MRKEIFILTLIFQIILLNAINLINPELCAIYNVITTSSATTWFTVPPLDKIEMIVADYQLSYALSLECSILKVEFINLHIQ